MKEWMENVSDNNYPGN